MKMDIVNYFKNRENSRRILTFLLTFLFIFSVLATSLITKKYNLKEGDIAKVDIKAQREVEDGTLTEERRQQAINSVPLQFNKKTEVKTEVDSDINDFFAALSQINNSVSDEKEKLQSLKGKTKISLSDEEILYALKLSNEESANVKEFLVKTLENLYDNNNISDNTQKSNQEDIKKAQEFVLIEVNSSKLTRASKEIAIAIAYSEIKPNFYYDESKTEELKREASKKVSPVMIKKDQIIVKEGEPVTKYQIGILEDLGIINNNNYYSGYLYICLGILIFFVLALEWYYLSKYYPAIFMDTKKLVMINILIFAAILLARTVTMVSPFLIPLAFIPMIFSLVVNPKVALVSSILNCILISGAVNFNIEITILAVINALVGATILNKMHQRNEILFSTLYIGVTNVILTFSVGLLISNNVTDVAKKAFFAFTASILSGILTIGFLPFFENVFDVVTTIKLLELSNPNNPLLKRLLIEAPGTYHHSILVGNLAELATEAVGGDAIFSRVCAYYHDVGKIKRPYFFKENQLENDNPHNKITPNLSTLIITSHVKDGVELAKEFKIPKSIIDVIEQHHGTSLVQYFYLTVKNSSLDPASIDEDDFRYRGPIPETKEAGIIMLADAVEAAVRSMSEPSKVKIEEKVNYIIKSRLNDGQLDNCDLTLRDIEKIKAAFLNVFNGIYHSRIEYPEDKWER
mgnify:CR=1 FL=1